MGVGAPGGVLEQDGPQVVQRFVLLVARSVEDDRAAHIERGASLRAWERGSLHIDHASEAVCDAHRKNGARAERP